MPQSITELRNRHKKIDIYVLCAGPSVNFIDTSFFDNKIIIGLNRIWASFLCDYSLHKHEYTVQDALNNIVNVSEIIVPKHDCACTTKKELKFDNDNYYQYTHKQGRFEDKVRSFQENLDALGKDDDLFSSQSTVTTGLHLAAYMGAKNIILVGHDCGYIDRESFVGNYGDRNKKYWGKGYNKYYNEWFKEISEQTERVKKALMDVYGCNIYSLNPFINFRLEGHKFETAVN